MLRFYLGLFFPRWSLLYQKQCGSTINEPVMGVALVTCNSCIWFLINKKGEKTKNKHKKKTKSPVLFSVSGVCHG